MKIKINVKIVLILVAFATGLFTSNVYATNVNNMSDLQNLFEGATVNENKITLDKNYVLNDDVAKIQSGDYEIDLNGYNIMSNEISAIEILGANLTISNSSSSVGLIYIDNEEDFASPIYISEGSLTINNGKIGNLEDATDCGLYIDGGTVVINNGEFAGLIHGLYMEDGKLTINYGSIKATTPTESNDAIGIYGGEVIINNGEFISSTLDGEGWGLYSENFDGKTSITINNGTFTGNVCGAQFYKESDNEFSVIINDGTFIGNYAGLTLRKEFLPNIEILAGTFKSISTNSIDRLGAIAIEYENTVSDINSIIKNGSSMYPSNTSLYSFTLDGNEYLFSRTENEVRIGLTKTISIPDSLHGKITANKETAIKGEEITLTITPEDGYKLKQMTVLDKFGEMPVEVTNNKFTMPNYNVIISSEFEKDENDVVTGGESESSVNKLKDETPKTGTSNYNKIGILVITISVLGIAISKKKEA